MCVWWDHCCIIYFEFVNFNQILNADWQTAILNSCNMYIKVFLRKCPIFIKRRNFIPHSTRIRREKNIVFKLVRSIPSTIFTRLCSKWFPPFLSSTKCSEWQKMLLRRSDENVSGKLLELETNQILLERNQRAPW